MPDRHDTQLHRSLDASGDPVTTGWARLADGIGGEVWGAPGSGVGGSLPWFVVTDGAYGAVGDGTTDDTAAINAAIAALNTATRGVLYFPSRTYRVTGALTGITADFQVLGDGSRAVTGGGLSEIEFEHASATCFSTTANVGLFRGIAIQNTAGSTPSAGAGIACIRTGDPWQRINYQDVFVAGFYDCIDIQNGTFWSMRDTLVMDGIRYNVRIRNLEDPDYGDWIIDGCEFGNNGVHTTDAALRLESSGGGSITNCKILGAIGYIVRGIDIAGAGNTSNLFVASTTIEAYGADGVRVDGQWEQMTFVGMEFGQYGNGTGHAFNLADSSDLMIDNIALRADTGTPTAILVSSMTKLAIGQLTNFGFATLISGSVDQDATGGVGARVFITGTPSAGQVPVASSGTAAAWDDAPGGSVALDDLTDVAITAPAEGDGLRYVGGSWVNARLLAEGLLTVDAGTPTYDDSGDDVVVTYASVWGYDGDGPYYDSGGVTTGEEAILAIDPDVGDLVLIPYNP